MISWFIPKITRSIASMSARSERDCYRINCSSKVEKCEFHADTISFLGYIISPGRITKDSIKVAAKEWSQPESCKQLQRFLGFANFYPRWTAQTVKMTVGRKRDVRGKIRCTLRSIASSPLP